MNRLIVFGLILHFCLTIGHAQKYISRDGKITFRSEAPLENIEALNNSASSVIDMETGRIEFAVLIKAFQFRKALMQEHFNESYLESDKFPKAVFKGQILNFDKMSVSTEGKHQISISGSITIHGVTKEINSDGIIVMQNGILSGKSNFALEVADFDIKVPGIMRQKIAEEINVFVDVIYQKFKDN